MKPALVFLPNPRFSHGKAAVTRRWGDGEGRHTLSTRKKCAGASTAGRTRAQGITAHTWMCPSAEDTAASASDRFERHTENLLSGACRKGCISGVNSRGLSTSHTRTRTDTHTQIKITRQLNNPEPRPRGPLGVCSKGGQSFLLQGRGRSSVAGDPRVVSAEWVCLKRSFNIKKPFFLHPIPQ